jgi:hypothetical protein
MRNELILSTTLSNFYLNELLKISSIMRNSFLLKQIRRKYHRNKTVGYVTSTGNNNFMDIWFKNARYDNTIMLLDRLTASTVLDGHRALLATEDSIWLYNLDTDSLTEVIILEKRSEISMSRSSFGRNSMEMEIVNDILAVLVWGDYKIYYYDIKTWKLIQSTPIISNHNITCCGTTNIVTNSMEIFLPEEGRYISPGKDLSKLVRGYKVYLINNCYIAITDERRIYFFKIVEDTYYKLYKRDFAHKLITDIITFDNERVLVGNSKGDILVLNPSSMLGKGGFNAHDDIIKSICLTDRYLVSSGSNRLLKLWNRVNFMPYTSIHVQYDFYKIIGLKNYIIGINYMIQREEKCRRSRRPRSYSGSSHDSERSDYSSDRYSEYSEEDEDNSLHNSTQVRYLDIRALDLYKYIETERSVQLFKLNDNMMVIANSSDLQFWDLDIMNLVKVKGRENLKGIVPINRTTYVEWTHHQVNLCDINTEEPLIEIEATSTYVCPLSDLSVLSVYQNSNQTKFELIDFSLGGESESYMFNKSSYGFMLMSNSLLLFISGENLMSFDINERKTHFLVDLKELFNYFRDRVYLAKLSEKRVLISMMSDIPFVFDLDLGIIDRNIKVRDGWVELVEYDTVVQLAYGGSSCDNETFDFVKWIINTQNLFGNLNILKFNE